MLCFAVDKITTTTSIAIILRGLKSRFNFMETMHCNNNNTQHTQYLKIFYRIHLKYSVGTIDELRSEYSQFDESGGWSGFSGVSSL